MNKLTPLLLLAATTVAVPGVAFARDITVVADMVRFGGNAAYLAIYITNPDGSYNSTLWVAGPKTRYLGHLRQWARGISEAHGNIDGITGASIGGGTSLTVKASVADALIDAGYEVHIDSAVENGGEFSSDAVVPLAAASSGVPSDGTGYVRTLTVSM